MSIGRSPADCSRGLRGRSRPKRGAEAIKLLGRVRPSVGHGQFRVAGLPGADASGVEEDLKVAQFAPAANRSAHASTGNCSASKPTTPPCVTAEGRRPSRGTGRRHHRTKRADRRPHRTVRDGSAHARRRLPRSPRYQWSQAVSYAPARTARFVRPARPRNQLDRMAAAGYHPSELWSEWVDETTAE